MVRYVVALSMMLLFGALWGQEVAPVAPEGEPVTPLEEAIAPVSAETPPAEATPSAETPPAETPPEGTPPAEPSSPLMEIPPAPEPTPLPTPVPVAETPGSAESSAVASPPAEAAPVAEAAPAAEAVPSAEPSPEEKAEAEKKAEEEKKEKEKKKFVKGEISNIGARDIVYPYNSLGIGTGVTFIAQDIFLTLDPRFVYNKNDFNMLMAFHLPINIRMFSFDLNRAGDDNFTLRSEDWDEWQDYFRIIRYVQYGRSEDNFYASIGSNNAQSIGHGTIMKRYVPNFDPNFTKISAKLNYYGDYFGFESVLGDVTDGNMFGGLVFFKPFSGLAEDENDYMPRSFSIGFSFAGDRKAPTKIEYVDYVFGTPGGDTYTADGNDPRWPAGLVPRIEVDGKGRPVVLEDTFLYLMGVDAEFKFFKNEYVDLKTYIDYSWMRTDPGRGGFTAGLLGRYSPDEDRKHALRSRIEARAYNGRYAPSFFDTFYDIERFELLTNIGGEDGFRPDGRSKLLRLDDQPDKFFFSLYAELTYSFIDWVTISMGIEQLRESLSIYAHLELPDLWIFKGMLSYYQRGITKPETMVDTFDYSAMFRGVIRLQVLPILFINAYVGKQWAFWPPNKPRDDGLQGHYLSAWDLGGDLEIGWEWGDDDEEEAEGTKDDEEKKEDEESIL
ncbi:MAG TPA: hypothetical protein PKH10_02600 [bacterium]|nr:hypothetical protein [bacterium]